MDFVPGHPDRDGRRRGRGVWQISGALFSVCGCTHWLVGPFHVGVAQPFGIALGGMDMGLNTQNLAGIIIVVFLTWLNVFGIKTGAAVQNVFTIAKVSALAALVLAGVFVARNAQAAAANFSNFWRLNLPHSAGGADSAAIFWARLSAC